MSRRTYAIAAIVLAAIIFVGVNIAADSFLTGWRIDLTENGQYTLSQGTRNIIAKLQEPITLRFFFSKRVAADYAQTNAYAQRVRDMLREFASRSHGNIILEEIDPEAYTPEEDEAAADGLSAAPTDTGEQVYFGLAGTNRIDGREIIPYFSPDREPFLAYDITSLIYRLTNPKKPEIGILSSLPLETGAGGLAAQMQGQAQPNAIYQELNQSFATQMIDPSFKQLPAGLDVLLIIHPAVLSDVQLYAIDQFVMSGGHALVFVDPNSELAQAGGGEMGGQGAAPPSSDLPKLFKAWGVSYDANKVVADRARAQRVQVSTDPRNPVADYPIWLHLTKEDFNQYDPVTANLQTLNLASAGTLKAAAKASTTFTPLVSSSDQANLLDAAQVRFNPRPQDLLADVLPTGERYTIAARITGPANTAFPLGPPIDTSAPQAGAPAPPPSSPQIRVSRGAINLIVMADSDIFDDRFWVRVENLFGNRVAAPFADNAAFVINAVENLTGSSDLISLRTRATNDRPFTVVRDLQAQAQARYQQETDTLQQRLTDTEQQLHDVEQGGSTNGQPTNSTTLTPQQLAAVERFRRELAQTRTALRDMQHNLRKDIDTLGDTLAFINILLIPLILSLVALLVAAMRRRRRAHHFEPSAKHG
jgi:ABC-type uncharacterized transport system involved in gliding motility auxiliary subunit